jgi:hypothetical protein
VGGPGGIIELRSKLLIYAPSFIFPVPIEILVYFYFTCNTYGPKILKMAS